MEDLRGSYNLVITQQRNSKSVPQFGAWDGKTTDQINYSVVFSKARANRKKHKTNPVLPLSLGNERELFQQQQHCHENYPNALAGMQRKHEKKMKKRWLSCFAF